MTVLIVLCVDLFYPNSITFPPTTLRTNVVNRWKGFFPWDYTGPNEGHISQTKSLARGSSSSISAEDGEGNFILVYTPYSPLFSHHQIDFTLHMAKILPFPALLAEMNHGNVPCK